MAQVIVFFSLSYAALNWLLFAWLALRPQSAGSEAAKEKGLDVELQGLDPDKVIGGTGKLASSFKTAGASASAAAMSLVGLVLATVAAGIDKL